MKSHSLEKKIYYHDTDCGNVVYYANYLKYLEEARTEYFLDKGINLKSLSDSGTWFVVANVSIDYKVPARYQDILQIRTKVEKIKSVIMLFDQQITRGNTLIAQARTTLVCVGKDFRPEPISAEVKNTLITE